MKIAICDDSQAELTALVKYAASDKHQIMAYLSGENLYREIENGGRFDLIFLDIDMPKMSGLETARAIRSKDEKTVIVFITNHAQYALEAFECEAFHYLIKPVSKDRISEIIAKAERKLDKKSDYCVIKTKGKSIKLLISDIYYLECMRKHVIYHTKDRSFETVDSLSNAFKALCAHDFIMVHQGYIVNMNKIVDFNDKFIILDNGQKVEMSVRKRKETLLKYAEFLERYI